MSAGLDASTVTPGNTPPDESRTVPVMDAWAKALGAAARNNATTRHAAPDMRITFPPKVVSGFKMARLLQKGGGHARKKESRRRRRRSRHKTSSGVVIEGVNAGTDATVRATDSTLTFDFEAVFHAHYRRIARVIVRVIQDPSRAEELAVDVFCKLWRHPSAHGPHCAGWLYRSAIRSALDELRKRTRREKYEHWFGINRPPPVDPEQSREVVEERTRIRTVLASLRSQDAQLVALRSEGLSYEDLAQALNLKPASIGTMLRRAQESFRREYITRYGDA